MTATRTRKTKPTTCTLVTRPVCPCELLPNGLAGVVAINGDAYALEVNAELPEAGPPTIFGFRVASPAGDVYDLPASLSGCDCPGHERWGHCKHATGLRDLRARGQI